MNFMINFPAVCCLFDLLNKNVQNQALITAGRVYEWESAR